MKILFIYISMLFLLVSCQKYTEKISFQEYFKLKKELNDPEEEAKLDSVISLKLHLIMLNAKNNKLILYKNFLEKKLEDNSLRQTDKEVLRPFVDSLSAVYTLNCFPLIADSIQHLNMSKLISISDLLHAKKLQDLPSKIASLKVPKELINRKTSVVKNSTVVIDDYYSLQYFKNIVQKFPNDPNIVNYYLDQIKSNIQTKVYKDSLRYLIEKGNK